ncbi:MAG: 30S ribosomal protein S2 [Candidatus Omnitrophica bacterium]|nr:30S ribosomal protein S2 [Candidatus Omnitrophota bacterium]MCB9746821.1 30S ribosomal protein S2 [Candidatus Omnitrophota bacterium]
MVDELIKKLLESGVHFGHQTQRWNPKMKKFIFGQRSGIYIIDLEKTVACLAKAQEFVRDITAKGGRILFVGTKKQAQPIVEEEAKKSDMYYVKNRWLGGLLTNFQTVRKSIDRLKTIEDMSKNGIWENLKKKEIARLTKEKERLLRDLDGIRNMKEHPQAIFIVDPKKEEIAIKEATKLGIPIVGLVDTNSDPDLLDFPIPGNDDALKSIRFITSLVAESVREGRKDFLSSETVKRPTQEASDKSAKTDDSSPAEESPAAEQSS